MVATFQANGSLQMEKNNPESTDPLKEFFLEFSSLMAQIWYWEAWYLVGLSIRSASLVAQW